MAWPIWERWDALGEDGTIYDPDMNSYNHYAYGAVCQWLFEGVAGVAPVPEKPGFGVELVDDIFLKFPYIPGEDNRPNPDLPA